MIDLKNGCSIFCLLLLPLFGVGQELEKELKESHSIQGEAFLKKASDALSYDSSIYYIHKALVTFKAIDNPKKILSCYNKLCLAHYNENNFLEYQKYALKAWEYAQTFPSKEGDIYTNARGNIAAFFLFKEDYTKTLALLKESLEQAEIKEDDYAAAIEANNIGFVYLHHIGDVDRAISFYNKAIDISQKFPEEDQPLVASFYSNKAYCLQEKQEWKTAEQYFQIALKIIGQINFSEYNERTKWYCLQNLADIAFSQNQNKKGLALANKALKLVNTYASIWDPQLTYYTLGNYYSDQKEYRRALSFFEKALAITRTNPEVHKSVNASCRLAQALCDLKQCDRALDSLQQALQILSPEFKDTRIRSNPTAASFLHKKSGLALIQTKATAFYGRYQQTNKIEDLIAALDNYQLASEIITELRQSYAKESSKSFLAKEANALYEKAINLALILHQKTGADRYLQEAFLFAERNKSVSLLESVKENLAMGFGALPKDLIQKEKELKSELAFLNKLIYLERKRHAEVEQLKPLEAKLFEAKEDHQDLVEDLEKNFPQYHQIKYQASLVGISALQNQVLDKKTALLEYFVGEEKVFLFCISQKSSKAYVFQKTPALLQSFEILRAIISNPPTGPNYLNQLAQFNQESSILFQKLLAPCLAELPKNIQQLLLIPDDFLNYLPFEILTRAPATALSYALADQQYLLEDFRISYHFSTALLLQNWQKQYEVKQTFAGFAPTFPELEIAETRTCENGQMHRLQCNQKEVENINKLMSGKVFIGKAASRNQLLHSSGQYQVLHLATHACLDQDDPNFNRIYFTDDYLSNFDLANCSLQANLVVLSACNTNSGSLIKGDGVMSLSKGFALAGCPSILTSLWAIDDCSSSAFMLSFYQNLKSGQSKDQALQAAKIDFLRQADKTTSHPYYWAPFLQFGETQALQFSNTWPFQNYLLLFLSSALFLFAYYRFAHFKQAQEPV